MYDLGKGVAVDLSKAMELYQLAGEDGWGVGSANAGDLYRLGLGVDKDLGKALELYEKAISQGNNVALGRKAMALAELYKEGDDPRPVVNALLRAASNSEPAGSVDLGLAYLNGSYGLPIDPMAASVHLTRGLDLGDPWGGIYLAMIEIARWDGDLERAQSVGEMLQTIAQGDAGGPRAQALALLGQLGIVVGAPRAQVTDLIERAFALNPEDDIVLNSRANLMVVMGNFAEADALLQKAVEAASDWAPYYARRSIVQLNLGNSERSKELENLANKAPEGQYFLQFIGK